MRLKTTGYTCVEKGGLTGGLVQKKCKQTSKIDRGPMMDIVNGEIATFLNEVISTCPAVTSIWLIGSRANRTATEASDWDFIAFGSEDAYTCLRESTSLHRPDTDFLVVVDGDSFRNAWGPVGKSG